MNVITKGSALLHHTGLRCLGLRKDGTRACNKLLVKKNNLGQIAGNYKCERCAQEIQVQCVDIQS